MKLDVTQVLKNMEGKTMKDSDGNGNAIDATIRMAIVNALLSPVQKDTGVDKMKKWELAQRVFKQDEVEVSIDDVKIIKDRIGELYPPLIVGQVWKILGE